jgi:hypothetical protein
MNNKINQDATKALTGFIYQFYEAIHWGFNLKKEQTIYFEKYGDITVSGDSNIEVKHYTSSLLTDEDENFWKTLSNWLHVDFDHSYYSSLILLTTQKISMTSEFLGWNKKLKNEKLNIIQGIITTANTRYDTKVKAYKAKLSEIAKDSSKAPAKKLNQPQKNKYLSKIEEKINTDSLLNIINKFVILDSSKLLPERYNELIDIYGKGVLEKNREHFIQAMAGYIMSPQSMANSWAITYDEFSQQVALLTQSLSSETRIFPTKNTTISKSDNDGYKDYLFVKKIEDINYQEAINDAHKDYSDAMCLIFEEFSAGEIKERLTNFTKQTISDFDIRYRKSKRNCNLDDIERHSQNFYDDYSLSEPPTFSGYESPQKSFRNGVLHIQMNEPAIPIKWKLK